MTAAGRPSSALLTSGALRNGIHGVTARSICPISPDRLRSKVEFAADEHVLSKAGLDYTLEGRGAAPRGEVIFLMPSRAWPHHDERPQGRLEGRTMLLQPVFLRLLESFTSSLS